MTAAMTAAVMAGGVMPIATAIAIGRLAIGVAPIIATATAIIAGPIARRDAGRQRQHGAKDGDDA